MKSKTFVLSAYYSAEKHGFKLDSVISGIVGRPATGAGTDLSTMTRDLGFEFKEEKEAKKALARLKKKKIHAEVRPMGS